MKYAFLVSLLPVFMLAPNAAQAQEGGFSATITVDENCNGQFSNTSGFAATLSCGQITDPGPGGLAGAVTYSLLSPPGLVGGDLILQEPGGSIAPIFTDLIRFNPNQTAPDSTSGTLVFYSDFGDGADSLADIGSPTAGYTNVVIATEVGPEGNNGFTYTPTAGQPGFVAGAAGPVTYVIQSDVTATPEPASILLMLGGAGFLLARKYCSSRARSTV